MVVTWLKWCGRGNKVYHSKRWQGSPFSALATQRSGCDSGWAALGERSGGGQMVVKL